MSDATDLNEAPGDLEHFRLAARLAGMELPDIALPASRQVVLGRMRLHYLDWGGEQRPVVLFLHGGGLNAHTWDLVCLALRHDYRCIALDQRGHGDSEWSPELDYGTDAHVGDLERLMAHLDVGRCVIVGQSMGALNGFAYAKQHPEGLAGLVLIDAGPGVRAAGAERILEFVKRTAEVGSVDDFVAAAVRFNPARDPRLLRRSVLHNLRRRADGSLMRKNDVRHLERRDVHRLIDDIAPCWNGAPSVSSPTLVVRGACSDVFLDEDAEHFASMLPRGRVARVEGAGHTVQGDNPRALAELLRDFLGELAW